MVRLTIGLLGFAMAVASCVTTPAGKKDLSPAAEASIDAMAESACLAVSTTLMNGALVAVCPGLEAELKFLLDKVTYDGGVPAAAQAAVRPSAAQITPATHTIVTRITTAGRRVKAFVVPTAIAPMVQAAADALPPLAL